MSDALDKAIWNAVREACTGYTDNDPPHAVTWARGGYRNDVPIICERCQALISTLKTLTEDHHRHGPDAEIEAAAKALYEHNYRFTIAAGNAPTWEAEDIPHNRGDYRAQARAALNAARGVTHD